PSPARVSIQASASDPVTTEAREGRGGESCPNKGQIYDRHNTPTPTLGQRGWRYSLHHRERWRHVRCRLVASWGWSRSQGLGCSPIKAVRELGLERRETVRSLSAVRVRDLRRAVPSTRGPGRTNLWCASCTARCTAG